MNKIELFLVVFFISVLNGCENQNNANPAKETQQILADFKQTSPTAKNLTDLPKVPKKTPKKKLVKHHTPAQQPESDENTNLEKELQNQPLLNLSLPFNTPNNNNNETSIDTNKPKYLPDLFSKKNKKHPLQIEGNLIKREEEATEKDRSVDGAEIEIELIN